MTDINYKKKYNSIQTSSNSPKKYIKDYSPITAEYLLKSNFLSEFKTEYEKLLARESLNLKAIGPYEEALKNGKVSSYEEWILLIKGDKGLDGTVSFDDLTEELKLELITKSITDTQFNKNSLYPLSNLAIYLAFSDLLDKYKDLLNMNISLATSISSILNLALHLGIPVVLVSEDVYDELELNNLINPDALYLTTDDESVTIKDLSGSWVFGGTFPITFGTLIEKNEKAFVFDGTFPLSFGTTTNLNIFDLEFPIILK